MKKNTYSEICIIDSVYAILVYLLIKQCKVENTFFIFWKNVPIQVRSKLKNHKVFDAPLDSISSPKTPFKNLQCIYKFYKLYKSLDLEGTQFCGQDHLPFSRMLLNFTSNTFIEYEDGYYNYVKRQRPLRYKLLRKLLLADVEEKFGHSPQVKKIYLTNPTINTFDDIKPKIEWVDLVQLWNTLSHEKQIYMCELFGLPVSTSDHDEIDTFIMTRPLSEDGECTEEEKISKVKDAISAINSQNFVIKPHYRETTDYQRYFPNAKVIKEKYPLELFFLKYGDVVNNIICVGDSSAKYFIYRYFKHIKFTII